MVLCQKLLFLHQLNPQYDNRLFIELPVQYMTIPSSEHGENVRRTWGEHVVHTNCFFVFVLTFILYWIKLISFYNEELSSPLFILWEGKTKLNSSSACPVSFIEIDEKTKECFLCCNSHRRGFAAGGVGSGPSPPRFWKIFQTRGRQIIPTTLLLAPP